MSSKRKERGFRIDIIIQIIMYIIVGGIWIVGFMPRIGFESYIKNYPIPVTMIFGGFISGFTICGGGAVSFPIFCKVLKLDPMMARDFSLGIQSFGMTCAAITILIKKIPIEKTVAICCTLGSFLGLIFGNIVIVPMMSSGNMKLLFSLMTAAFGVTLFFRNYAFNKKCTNIYDALCGKPVCNISILLCIGFIGGIFTSVLGTGADIIAFSACAILFKLNEKVLNPTSDIIMAISSVMGLLMRGIFFGGIHSDAASAFPLAIPIVVIMAPLGAIAASKIERHAVVKFLLFFIVVDVVSTFRTVHLNVSEKIVTLSIFTGILLFYYSLVKLSDKMLKSY